MRSLIIAIMANLSFTACISQGPFFQAKDLDLIVSQAKTSGDIIQRYGEPAPKELVLQKQRNYEPSGEPINLDEVLTHEQLGQEQTTSAEDDSSLEQTVEFMHEGEHELSCPEAKDSMSYFSQRVGWLISVEEQHITIFLDQNARACGYQLQTFTQSI
ncbi:MAG: hypothetical protein ACOH5I_03175 [Oligoflexus sp.]